MPSAVVELSDDDVAARSPAKVKPTATKKKPKAKAKATASTPKKRPAKKAAEDDEETLSRGSPHSMHKAKAKDDKKNEGQEPYPYVWEAGDRWKGKLAMPHNHGEDDEKPKKKTSTKKPPKETVVMRRPAGRSATSSGSMQRPATSMPAVRKVQKYMYHTRPQPMSGIKVNGSEVMTVGEPSRSKIICNELHAQIKRGTVDPEKHMEITVPRSAPSGSRDA